MRTLTTSSVQPATAGLVQGPSICRTGIALNAAMAQGHKRILGVDRLVFADSCCCAAWRLADATPFVLQMTL